jgi:hypothetical protein
MISPIKLDGSEFVLQNVYAVNKFIDLGLQKGNKGVAHTLFLNKPQIHPKYFTGDSVQINGICSYRFLYNNNSSYLVGAVFSSPIWKTRVADYFMAIGDDTEPSGAFEPSFILEKSIGLILFEARDSSVLAIPSEVDSSLLIKTV